MRVTLETQLNRATAKNLSERPEYIYGIKKENLLIDLDQRIQKKIEIINRTDKYLKKSINIIGVIFVFALIYLGLVSSSNTGNYSYFKMKSSQSEMKFLNLE